MIKDVTIGQYYNADSFIHKLDPRSKIILTFAYIIALFLIVNPLGYIVAVLITISFYILGRLKFTLALKNIKPLIPILIFTGLLNLFLISSGDLLVSFGVFKITKDGVKFALTMILRLILLISGASVLTYTTLPITLTDAIESLLNPLKRFHFPSHELAMMMTIALRFIPTLIEETQKIIAAQKSRGADFETGSVIKRAKALTPVFVPLFISSFKRAEDLALAMEARCYNGGEGRTRLHELRYSGRDLVAVCYITVFIAAIILINLFAPVII